MASLNLSLGTQNSKSIWDLTTLEALGTQFNFKNGLDLQIRVKALAKSHEQLLEEVKAADKVPKPVDLKLQFDIVWGKQFGNPWFRLL